MFLLLILAPIGVQAQSGPLRQGDPPVAALITVSTPDSAGFVTITGANGSVFPGAQVAVRNLYTEDLAYTTAGINGGFSVRIYGPGRTPFLISPAASIPAALRSLPGALPGGPATIVYGATPQPAQDALPVTALVLDGLSVDWMVYEGAGLGGGLRALVNNDALYIALGPVPQDYSTLRLTLELDSSVYVISLTPRLLQTATLRQTAPVERDLGTLAVAAVEGLAAVELRVPLARLAPAPQQVIVREAAFLAADGTERTLFTSDEAVLAVAEQDGVVYDSPLDRGSDAFFVAGPVSGGASAWTARGRIASRALSPGDELVLELDVTLNAPDLPASLVGLRMLGELWLQPVIGPDGVQRAGGLNSNNGWSSLLTPGGLAIDNLRGDFLLGTAATEAARVIRRGDNLIFGLQFRLTLPANLPAGRYVPLFTGLAQIGDGEPFRWDESAIFATGGGQLSRVRTTRLPLVLNVGSTEGARLFWALFYDHPSDGSRGILPAEDGNYGALSNRVRFNSPTYILPPGSYPLEPYLPAQMPNAYDTSAAPLLPLLLPGGRLSGRVTRPDGTVDDLDSVSFAQSLLSTSALDERTVFGAGTPLDMLRLSTLNPLYTSYAFDHYGEYTLNLSGSIEDIWGNRYDGGGSYRLLIAEALELRPGVLPGTPFFVGDVLNPSVQLIPHVPAEVTLYLRVWPLDGSAPLEWRLSGRADARGFFFGPEVYTFDTSGEYILDYEARYTDAEGRLWAASLRSAGVVARPDGSLMAHGRRGIDLYYGPRSAWFSTATYPAETSADARPNYPYYSGDVARVPDVAGAGIRPIVQVRDVSGRYGRWLMDTWPDYSSALGPLGRLLVEDELPLVPVLGGPPTLYGPALRPEMIVNQAYGYVSAVRPDITLAQFVHGGDDDSLHTAFDNESPFNGQIGAGVGGNRPGDYAFLFGGAVVRNAEAGIFETAAYASLMVVVPGGQEASVYPPYQGQAGGAAGGPLLAAGPDVEMFFLPTGTRPGQVLTVGSPLVVAGHVGPPLASHVEVTVLSPSGETFRFSGQASPVGYFYDPAAVMTLDEVGIWSVRVTVMHEGITSVGPVEAPYPRGGVPGAADGQYYVYVLPEGSPSLSWNRGGDIDTATQAGAPLNLTINFPAGWTNISAHHSITTAAYVLAQGPLQRGPGSLSYQFSPLGTSRDFPQIETGGSGSGPAASDVITLTLVLTGLDTDGQFAIRTRTFTLLHDRLVSLEPAAGGE